MRGVCCQIRAVIDKAAMVYETCARAKVERPRTDFMADVNALKCIRFWIIAHRGLGSSDHYRIEVATVWIDFLLGDGTGDRTEPANVFYDHKRMILATIEAYRIMEGERKLAVDGGEGCRQWWKSIMAISASDRTPHYTARGSASGH